jgi:hypothetical protein
MSDLKDKLARAWAEDLTSRLPGEHVVYPGRRDGDVKPPFTVLVIRRMEQTTPGSDVWTAEGRLVVVCDAHQSGTPEQEQRLKEAHAALAATDTPCHDAGNGVRLYGFSVDTVEQATAAKVYSDVIFFTAGVGRYVAAE